MNVAKIGGSSLSTAELITAAIKIITERNYQAVVVSAPGKAHSDDVKVTDLLFQWFQKPNSKTIREKITQRYQEIISGLGIETVFDLDAELSVIQDRLPKEQKPDYALSRGEYLNAKIIASAMGQTFIDPMKYIVIKKDGTYKCDTEALKQDVGGSLVIMPGFYGSTSKGNVRTFSRGGSDITGAIVAAALGAQEYHNWTDVSGVYTADPRIVSDAKKIDLMTYREVRELGNLGTAVFHPDAIRPVKIAGIPTIIKNTREPNDPGTRIVNAIPFDTENYRVVTGIARTDQFLELRIEYLGMGNISGYTEKILRVLRKQGVSYAIKPESQDSMSLILSSSQLEGKLEDVLDTIRKKVPRDKLSLNFDLSLISIVGANMKNRPGISARVFETLADAGISVVASTQGGSEISITIVVDSDASNRALLILHKAFF
jgi:aspartate kinase